MADDDQGLVRLLGKLEKNGLNSRPPGVLLVFACVAALCWFAGCRREPSQTDDSLRILNDRDIGFIDALTVLDSTGSRRFLARDSGFSLRDSILYHATRLGPLETGTRTADSLAVKSLITFIYDSLALEPVFDSENPNYFLPTGILRGRKGSCLGLSLLFLALGEAKSLPLRPVYLPGHIYLRFESGHYSRNIETLRKGLERSDRYYDSTFRLDRRPWYGSQNLPPRAALAGLLFNLGNSLLKEERKENWEDAGMRFQAAEGLLPGFPEALGNLGVLHLRLGERRLAMRSFQKVLEADPFAKQAWINLAKIHMQEESWNEAEKCYAWLAENFPDEAGYAVKRDHLRKNGKK